MASSAFGKAKETARQATGMGDGRSYFGADAKERIAENYVPLYLHSANRVKGKFGMSWELELSENDPTEKTSILSMPANDYRDELFRNLRDDLKNGPVGPLALLKREYKQGNGWDLDEWTED